MVARDPVLDIRDLTKRFGRTVANDRVDLRVQPGQVVGLLGHNGAGKTTLVNQTVGLLRPDAGHIRVAGTDAVAHPAVARRSVALQPQQQAPLDGLTPRSAIENAARLRGLSPAAARDGAVALAEELDIGEWLDQRALPSGGGISGGVRRLTAFAMAAVAPTPLVVLDEPTNDVDASRRRLLWQVVRRLGDRGAGVLLVTHNVVESERVVDELVILDRGHVVATGTPAQLHDGADELRLELVLHGDHDDPTEATTPPITVARRVRSKRRVLLTIAPTDAAAAVAWATQLREDEAIESFSLAPATLEDAYLALTADTPALEHARD